MPFAGFARVSPTARFTGAVWRRYGLSPTALHPRSERLLADALRLGGPLGRRLPLEGMLRARHCAIDALLARAIAEGRIAQVVELAAGHSARGWRMKQRFVDEVTERIEQIAAELSAETAADVRFEMLARRDPGGVPFNHPLVSHTRAIMDALDIEPRIAPSMSELSTFIQHDIPALTLGITTGQRHRKPDERLDIPPIHTGLTQLIGLLIALDEDWPDDTEQD